MSDGVLAEYNETTATTVAGGLEIEARNFLEWRRSFDPAQVESRRAGIVDRGRIQG